MAKKKINKSIFIALKGLAHGFSRERNIKIQMLIGLLVIILALLLKIPKTNFVLIMIVTFIVIISELMNTSLEKLIDHIHPKQHDEIRKVKDMMAGAVLLSVLLAVIVGLIILLMPVIELFK
ncbi:diacylglycerol kinase [Candidatus Woesearchaeota archaeon]|nr:diacylglycerol kinase [Candidatus Woesearchaeota archaeon]